MTYYPPPPVVAPPAYTSAPQTAGMTSPLLDICVDKTLQLVLRELTGAVAPLSGPLQDAQVSASTSKSASDSSTDQEDLEDENIVHSNLSRDLSTLGQPDLPSNQGRLPKRQRNYFDLPRSSASTPDGWPFLRELAGILDCDVCAMLLHEPVTTPCQHVSSNRINLKNRSS